MNASAEQIMLLNLLFSSSLGVTALALLAAAMRAAPGVKREKLLLSIRKGGAPFGRTAIQAGTYRIGRAGDCDIVLEGAGIPLVAGELVAGKRLLFRLLSDYPVMKNRSAEGYEFEVTPGDEVSLFDYSLRVERA